MVTIKVKKIIVFRPKILDLFVLVKALKFNLFLKKSENIWIIVIVVFYKNYEIFATQRG